MEKTHQEWIDSRAQAIHEMGEPWSSRHVQNLFFEAKSGKRDLGIVKEVAEAVKKLQDAE